MLGQQPVIAFVPTSDSDRAKTFYGEVLGLEFVSDEPYALVFSAGGTMLRIAKVQALEPAPFTVLGWQVADIVESAAVLSSKGVLFERYDFLEQDRNGIWSSGVAKVAWFKDPDGNLLSLTQF